MKEVKNTNKKLGNNQFQEVGRTVSRKVADSDGEP